jgi:internalin A
MGTDADNGDLELLRAFPKLKKLDLTRCTKINNVGLEWLEDFKEIRVLKLGFCSHVSDGGMEFIGKLTSLEELNLDQTIVTDLGLRDLKNLKNLKKLSISGALASGRGLEGAIPGLQIIQ